MPTNANVFNSRVTSEALETKFRQVFPAQGGAELVQDLFASGVIQPVVDFSSVAEGSVLAPDLQTAWDFSTGHTTVNNTTTTLINNTGFWKVSLNVFVESSTAAGKSASVYITDLLTTRPIWEINTGATSVERFDFEDHEEFVVFLRAGDTLVGTASPSGVILDVVYRQIADVNGNLVNPLGFTFS